eukprot:scaffold25035_cov162-Cylindrotheca_fusiformis.AAC.3
MGVRFVRTTERNGKYTAPKTISVLTLAGGAKIDFSLADFVYPETTILVASCITGRLTVEVPRGVRVEIRGIGILGRMRGLEDQNMPVGQSGPLIIVKGAAIMGGVKVVLNENVPPIKVVE